MQSRGAAHGPVQRRRVGAKSRARGSWLVTAGRRGGDGNSGDNQQSGSSLADSRSGGCRNDPGKAPENEKGGRVAVGWVRVGGKEPSEDWSSAEGVRCNLPNDLPNS